MSQSVNPGGMMCVHAHTIVAIGNLLSMPIRPAVLALLLLLLPRTTAAQTEEAVPLPEEVEVSADDSVALGANDDVASDDVTDDDADGDAGEEADAFAEPSSRRDTRIRDHALGVGFYYTHMQWKDNQSLTFPSYDMYSMAIRYSYYIGQAQKLGFILNTAAYLPMRVSQQGIDSNPALNGAFSVFETYDDRHVGFDLNFMAGSHRMLTPDLAMIAGIGMHVGMVKLNDAELAIHEYIAVGISSVFSLRYHIGELWTVGGDATVSSDFRDMIDHRNPLDWSLNVGLTLNAGLHF